MNPLMKSVKIHVLRPFNAIIQRAYWWIVDGLKREEGNGCGRGNEWHE